MEKSAATEDLKKQWVGIQILENRADVLYLMLILYKNVLKYFYKRECNLKRKVALYLRSRIESPELYLRIFAAK